jgi:hypothetical protein
MSTQPLHSASRAAGSYRPESGRVIPPRERPGHTAARAAIPLRRESAHYVALLPRSEGAIVGSDTGRPLIDGETLRPVTGHDGSLVLEHARVFDAPTEQGFRLFTDPTELVVGPAWVHNARDPDRLRVGGSLRFTVQPARGRSIPSFRGVPWDPATLQAQVHVSLGRAGSR